MFDFSIGKVAILFALCLMVLGPEKLPKLAQQLGRLAGQARAMARHFRMQLEQEIAADELSKQKREFEATLKESVDVASSPITTVAETAREAAQEIQPIMEPLDPLLDPGAANGSGHSDYDSSNDPHLVAPSAETNSPNHDWINESIPESIPESTHKSRDSQKTTPAA